MLRTCFRLPIPEIFYCAELLRQAVKAHQEGEMKKAYSLFAEANDEIVRQWLESVWGKGSEYVQYRLVEGALPIIDKSMRVEVRMPTLAEKIALHHRDGFNCRFCGIPVIRKEVRVYLHKLYPEAIPWGRKNIVQHSAFQALWAQYDHILPHARGGGNHLDNMVVTCAACNFGRMDFTLEEVGLQDPRFRTPCLTEWNGLEQVLPSNKRIELLS